MMTAAQYRERLVRLCEAVVSTHLVGDPGDWEQVAELALEIEADLDHEDEDKPPPP